MATRQIFPGWPDVGEEFHELVASLVLVLEEECRQYRRFTRVVRKKVALKRRGAWHELEGTLRTEKEVLADCVTLGRDRLAMVQALGESIGPGGVRRPRIAELVGYAVPDARDELLDLRDELRDLAEELETLGGGGSFSRHISGNMRLYLREPAEAGDSDDPRREAGLTPLASPARDDV